VPARQIATYNYPRRFWLNSHIYQGSFQYKKTSTRLGKQDLAYLLEAAFAHLSLSHQVMDKAILG